MLFSLAVKNGPLEYLYPGVPFEPSRFPDLWWPIMVASAVLLVGTVILYNVRVRQLHRDLLLARGQQQQCRCTGKK